MEMAEKCNDKIVLTEKELGRIKEDVKDVTVFRTTTLIKLAILEKKQDKTNGSVLGNIKSAVENRTAHKFFNWALGIQFALIVMVISMLLKVLTAG